MDEHLNHCDVEWMQERIAELESQARGLEEETTTLNRGWEALHGRGLARIAELEGQKENLKQDLIAEVLLREAAEAKLARVKKEILERDVYGDELDPDDLLQILNDKEGE